MSLTGCQINPIHANFHLQKSLKIVDENSADKIWSKNDKGMENVLPHANLWLSTWLNIIPLVTTKSFGRQMNHRKNMEVKISFKAKVVQACSHFLTFVMLLLLTFNINFWLSPNLPCLWAHYATSVILSMIKPKKKARV